jgi:hypothetical protein
MANHGATPLELAIKETIAANPEQVARWQDNLPGAWGFLAGQGILAYRRRLGRSLTDTERRRLWSALWARLEATRH